MQARHKSTPGFTLVELLIVIAIIGLLATLAIVSLTTAQRKARDTKRIADLNQLQNAVELYYSENAAYPDSNVATTDTWSEFGTVIGPYITNVPIDPTNATSGGVAYAYNYGTNDDNTEYFIGAPLEDAVHSALNGDDDTAYSQAAPAGWGALDIVSSTDAAPSAVISFDCSVARNYCVSE